MTDHKYTDEELVSKLGKMTTGGHCCDDCSYADLPHPGCKQLIMDQAYDLINRQRAKIDDLTRDTIPKLKYGLERANKYGVELEKKYTEEKK